MVTRDGWTREDSREGGAANASTELYCDFLASSEGRARG